MARVASPRAAYTVQLFLRSIIASDARSRSMPLASSRASNQGVKAARNVHQLSAGCFYGLYLISLSGIAGTASQLLSAAATLSASLDPEQTLKAAAQLALDALEWRRESRYAQPQMLQAAQLTCAEECGLLYLSPLRTEDGRCLIYGRARQDPWDPESGETLSLMVRLSP